MCDTVRRVRAASASLALAILIAGCGSAGAQHSRSGAEPGSDLPTGKLAGAGITLSTATEPATITRQKALAELSGLAEDIALRHVQQPVHRPPLDTNAWVISTNPNGENEAGGPGGSSPAPETFSVVLIDAQTGDLIEQVSGS